jgi:polynucleotide 5'-hydroxyl-kinase GRC3/NOL9
MQELVSPGAWNKKLSGLAAARRKATPVIFLCGPKSSGKSTFGRLLANRFITDRGGARNKPWSSVMVLDLDPGQPEYSPPGVVSLSKISTPNLSPSDCHPTLTPAQGQVRAHAIASVTPALDPSHFIECALDLFAHYQRGPDANCPLVINTPGWIQGTGLDILSELITALRPTEVLYMSQDGPSETVSTLQSASQTPVPPIPFTTLPSQPTDTAPPRTPSHLRTMQTMSYFHLFPTQSQTWDPTPLTDHRPWRVRYTTGFRGILCYDHQPAANLLAEAINGTILALVKLESSSRALRDLLPPPPPHSPNPPSSSDPNPDQTHNDEKKENQQGEIPLIPNPQGRTLDPRYSQLLGLVLVRGVDVMRQELQLLTPLSGDVIAGLEGKELVLVAGRFDTPSWAYAEDLYRRNGGAGEVRVAEEEDGGEEEEESDGEDEEGEKEVPWVEMLHGSQKRAVGSKVWRVRRDVGRT